MANPGLGFLAFGPGPEIQSRFLAATRSNFFTRHEIFLTRNTVFSIQKHNFRIGERLNWNSGSSMKNKLTSSGHAVRRSNHREIPLAVRENLPMHAK
jgi:hypothetical protein